MWLRNRVLVVSAIVAAAGMDARAQSSGVNPDISVIPSFVVCPQGEERCAFAEADGKIDLQEVELALQGYLNPFVRGDVFVAVGEEGVEVEEAYATVVRGLGPFQAKLGKYRVDWGTVNPLHPHAYSWIFAPLVEERLFGPEGLNQIGGNLNAAFRAGERGQVALSLEALRGDLGGDFRVSDDPEAVPTGLVCVGPGCQRFGENSVFEVCRPGSDCALVPWIAPEEPSAGPRIAWHGKASYFSELAPGHSLQVAVNGLTGTLDPVPDRKVTLYGLDFKYRWRPNKYESVNLIGSWIASRADLEERRTVDRVCVGPDCGTDGSLQRDIPISARIRGDRIATSGGYLIVDWQFDRRWNAGLKLDRAQWLDREERDWRAEAFVNFRLLEESTLFRFLVRREGGDSFEAPRWTTALQLVFSLGPHRPHMF